MNEEAQLMSYSKLFSSIVHSTIWQEQWWTKIVWITMLALSNREGEVEASVPGLARAASVSINQCEDALVVLQSPDPYSRTKDYEGRRIGEMQGGWLILNYATHRAKIDPDERREKTRIRVAKFRSERKQKDERISDQGGRCGCCGNVFEEPHGKYTVADHDHETGAERDIICQSCNKVTGQLENGKVILDRRKGTLAEAYVARHAAREHVTNVTPGNFRKPEVALPANTETDAAPEAETEPDTEASPKNRQQKQQQKHSAPRRPVSTALWLFTNAFNKAYSKRLKPPTLTKSSDKHFRALLQNYGHKTVACLPLIAWVYDHKQGGDGRCKSRAASHLLRDGERTFLWSSLFERLDQIRQSGGAIKRICEIAEELEILSELNDLGVKYEPDETEIPQGKPEDFAPPKMSTSDMIMKMRREGIPGDS